MTARDELEAFSRRQIEPLGAVEVEGRATLRIGMAGKEILRIKAVSTLDDVMALRILRNECREFMTHRREEISEAEQLVWWQSVGGNPKWRIWLVYVPGWDDAVGFVMLRKVLIRWFVTLGLRPWLRGQGIGTELYRAMRSVCEGDVQAVIRTDNVASIRAAEKAGYEPMKWDFEGQVALVGRRADG
jgi:RimJ/RimL family protein N-acetyltransferase